MKFLSELIKLCLLVDLWTGPDFSFQNKVHFSFHLKIKLEEWRFTESTCIYLFLYLFTYLILTEMTLHTCTMLKTMCFFNWLILACFNPWYLFRLSLNASLPSASDPSWRRSAPWTEWRLKTLKSAWHFQILPLRTPKGLSSGHASLQTRGRSSSTTHGRYHRPK